MTSLPLADVETLGLVTHNEAARPLREVAELVVDLGDLVAAREPRSALQGEGASADGREVFQQSVRLEQASGYGSLDACHHVHGDDEGEQTGPASEVTEVCLEEGQDQWALPLGYLLTRCD